MFSSLFERVVGLQNLLGSLYLFEGEAEELSDLFSHRLRLLEMSTFLKSVGPGDFSDLCVLLIQRLIRSEIPVEKSRLSFLLVALFLSTLVASLSNTPRFLATSSANRKQSLRDAVGDFTCSDFCAAMANLSSFSSMVREEILSLEFLWKGGVDSPSSVVSCFDNLFIFSSLVLEGILRLELLLNREGGSSDLDVTLKEVALEGGCLICTSSTAAPSVLNLLSLGVGLVPTGVVGEAGLVGEERFLVSAGNS